MLTRNEVLLKRMHSDPLVLNRTGLTRFTDVVDDHSKKGAAQ